MIVILFKFDNKTFWWYLSNYEIILTFNISVNINNIATFFYNWRVVLMYSYRETEVTELIKRQLIENSILIYMKGTPTMPRCGFSSQAVSAIKDCGQEFKFIDILKNPDIRSALPKYANWPTFPQLYVHGELIGGADIILEMHESGELKRLIESASSKT